LGGGGWEETDIKTKDRQTDKEIKIQATRVYFPFSLSFYSLYSKNMMLAYRKGNNSYLYTYIYDLYGPVRNAFDAGSIHYEGKWEGAGPWKSRLSWAL
jgi:hypothetical protein